MTFDLDAPTLLARDRARAAAAALTTAAAEVDASAVIPDAVRTQARDGLAAPTDRLAWVVGLEELAVVSGSLAMDAALTAERPGTRRAESRTWMGLRGVALDTSGPAALSVAAVLLGLARGALDAALAPARAEQAAGRPAQPHWTLADAATELDAARLLTWRAASVSAAAQEATLAAMARMQARMAAESVVAAARRVLDADAATSGSTLDRITRDVATLTLVCAGADGDERAVAAGVLPG
jgi:hypothetical protein